MLTRTHLAGHKLVRSDGVTACTCVRGRELSHHQPENFVSQ